MSQSDRKRRREKQSERSLGIKLLLFPPFALITLFIILFAIHLVLVQQGPPMKQAAYTTMVFAFAVGAFLSAVTMATGMVLIMLSWRK